MHSTRGFRQPLQEIRPPIRWRANDDGPITPAQFEAAMAARPDPSGKVFVSRCRFSPFSSTTTLYAPFAARKLQTRSWATQSSSLRTARVVYNPQKRVEHRHQPDQPQQRGHLRQRVPHRWGCVFMSAWTGEDFHRRGTSGTHRSDRRARGLRARGFLRRLGVKMYHLGSAPRHSAS